MDLLEGTVRSFNLSSISISTSKAKAVIDSHKITLQKNTDELVQTGTDECELKQTSKRQNRNEQHIGATNEDGQLQED